MSGKCTDCNKEYIQFQATSTKNDEGIFITRRYYRCPECRTIYVETDTPDGVRVTKFPPKKPSTLDKWM